MSGRSPQRRRLRQNKGNQGKAERGETQPSAPHPMTLHRRALTRARVRLEARDAGRDWGGDASPCADWLMETVGVAERRGPFWELQSRAAPVSSSSCELGTLLGGAGDGHVTEAGAGRSCDVWVPATRRR